MRGGRISLLRPVAPVAVAFTLAVAPAAHGAPDPAPGSKTLRPDPVPSAAPAPAQRSAPVHAATAPAPKTTGRVVITRPAAPRVVVTHTTVVTPAKPKPAVPAVQPAPPKHAAPVTKHRLPSPFVLPPIPVPHIVTDPLERRPSPLLAAFALALAALAAGSGAQLVRAWSTR